MSKRTNNITAVTIARYATMYVEADTVNEAVYYAAKHCSELSDHDFEESDQQVDSYENYSTDAEAYMDKIYTTDGVKTYEEYMDELENQE